MKSINFTGNNIEKFNIAIFATLRKWYETFFFCIILSAKLSPSIFNFTKKKRQGIKSTEMLKKLKYNVFD